MVCMECLRPRSSGANVLQAVMAVDDERQRLEREAEGLLGSDSEEAQTRLEDLYERCARQWPLPPCMHACMQHAYGVRPGVPVPRLALHACASNAVPMSLHDLHTCPTLMLGSWACKHSAAAVDKAAAAFHLCHALHMRDVVLAVPHVLDMHDITATSPGPAWLRLEALDAATTEARAAQLRHGLGFTKTMQAKATRDFSGGWRMRIALARALFVDPTFLILDGAREAPAPEPCLQAGCPCVADEPLHEYCPAVSVKLLQAEGVLLMTAVSEEHWVL